MNGLQQFINFWWHWNLHMFWQVALLITLLSVADWLLRDRVWPQVRYGLWLLVLVKLIVPPDWSAPTGVFSHLLPAVEHKTSEMVAIPPATRDNIQQTPHTESAPQPHEPSTQPLYLPQQPPEKIAPVATQWLTLRNLAFLIWITGMTAFSLLLIMKTVRLRNWHREHNDASLPSWFHALLMDTSKKLDLGTLPAIVFSPEATSPAVYGLFKPVLLLPARYFDNLDKEQAEHVLLHELAHLKRGDLYLNALDLTLQVIYWYHPLVHWAGSQIKHVREICCDLTVANILQEKTKNYRQTLIDTARTLLTESPEVGLAFLGIFEEPFRLVSRIRWLDKKSLPQPEKSLLTAFIISMLVVVFVLPMSGMERGKEALPQKRSTGIAANKMYPLAQQVLPGDNNTGYFYTLKTSEPFYAITRSVDGSWELVNEAMRQLQAYMQKQHIQPDGPSFIVNKSTDFGAANEHVMQWQVGYPVPRDYTVQAPYTCELYPERKTLYVRMGERYDNDALNMQLTDVMFAENLINDGPVLIFCPDKLYNQGKDRHWSVQIPVKQSEKPFPKVSVQTTWTEPMLAMVRRWTGSYDQEEKAKKDLESMLKRDNIKPDGPVFYRYLNDEMKVDKSDLQWDIGIEVPQGTVAEYPYEIRRFPAERVVTCTIQCKPDDIIPNVYGFALEYTREGLFPVGYPMRFVLQENDDGSQKMEFRVAVRNQQHNQLISLPSFY